MGMIGGTLGYRILRAISPAEPTHMSGSAYAARSKIQELLGSDVWNEIRGKVVVDFGCGKGTEAIELAQRGAQHVYGVDILERWLATAREEAAKVSCHNVFFGEEVPSHSADVIISIDAFEHFEDTAAVLETMATMLKPGGVARILWPDLVSPVRRTSVFCISVGPSSLQRAGTLPLA
jgi:2-polyprenyl-3-methyl-5-hydroxy-6-metoxy-1,4-benzoquinol methylase